MKLHIVGFSFLVLCLFRCSSDNTNKTLSSDISILSFIDLELPQQTTAIFLHYQLGMKLSEFNDHSNFLAKIGKIHKDSSNRWEYKMLVNETNTPSIVNWQASFEDAQLQKLNVIFTPPKKEQPQVYYLKLVRMFVNRYGVKNMSILDKRASNQYIFQEQNRTISIYFTGYDVRVDFYSSPTEDADKSKLFFTK